MSYKVYQRMPAEDSGFEIDEVPVTSDDFRYKEVGENRVYIEFYTNDQTEYVFDAGSVLRIKE